MSGPPVIPGGTKLLAEFRWLNWLRHAYLVIALLFIGILVPIGITFFSSQPSPVFDTILLLACLLAVAYIVAVGYFRWLTVRRMAGRASAKVPGSRSFIYSRVECAQQRTVSVRGPGWLLITHDGLAIAVTGRVPLGLEPGQVIDEIAASDIVGCRRHEVAGGHAYSRLLIETSDDRRYDFALTAQSGLSVRGVEDRTVDHIADVIWTTIARPPTDVATGP